MLCQLSYLPIYRGLYPLNHTKHKGLVALPLIDDLFAVTHFDGNTDGISRSVLTLRQMSDSDNGDWLFVALFTVLSQAPVRILSSASLTKIPQWKPRPSGLGRKLRYA